MYTHTHTFSVRSGVSSNGTGATAATGALVWSRDMPDADDISVRIKVPEGWTRKSKSHAATISEKSYAVAFEFTVVNIVGH
jgi:hypothetical protein